MKFLTENESKLVPRFHEYPSRNYRIGSRLVGIKHGGQRPKYVLLDHQDLLELNRGIMDTPDKVVSWIQKKSVAHIS
ncbi:MAG TPA: hypothetical protein VFM18_06380 [Methanosarcina sp.]|nr:hypothetical protein [Methanosarcina sp.]